MLIIITKRCSQCGILKSTDEFHRNSSHSDGLSSQCKKCADIYQLNNKKTKKIKRKLEDIEHLPEEKKCGLCGKTKPQSEFYLNSHTVDGLMCQCIECRKEYKKINDKSHWLKKKFGINEAQYDLMLEKQGGVCAMCGCTPEENGKALAVDHNHKTGKIRGLLCSECNRGIGHLKDSSKLMRIGADYLDSEFLE